MQPKKAILPEKVQTAVLVTKIAVRQVHKINRMTLALKSILQTYLQRQYLSTV